MRWLVIACTLWAAPSLAQEPDGPEDEHHPPQAPPPQQQYYVAPQQFPPPPLPPPPPPLPARDEIDRLERSGKSMKAGGATMLALGIALEITGQVLVLYTQFAPEVTCVPIGGGRQQCTESLDVGKLAGGIAAGVAGAGLLYGGMAVMSAGNARVRRAQALRARLGMSIGMNAVGLRLAAEF